MLKTARAMEMELFNHGVEGMVGEMILPCGNYAADNAVLAQKLKKIIWLCEVEILKAITQCSVDSFFCFPVYSLYFFITNAAQQSWASHVALLLAIT